MSDNRTTELREKLDELGIEHTDASYKRKVPITVWQSNGATFCFVESSNQIDLHIENPTPEQAIAATLGRSKATSNQESIVRSFLRKISPNRDWDYLGEHEHALIADLISDIAATLGSDASAVRLAERLRSIADEMRNIGASTMTPHELLAFYAREVDKVADSLKFVTELGSERKKVDENREHVYDLLRGLLEECKKCPDI